MSPRVAVSKCFVQIRSRRTGIGARADGRIAAPWSFWWRVRPPVAGLVGVAVIAILFVASASCTSLDHTLLA